MTISEFFHHISYKISAAVDFIAGIDIKYIYWPVGVFLGLILFWTIVAHLEAKWEEVKDKTSMSGFIWVIIILLYMIFVVTPDLFEVMNK